MTTPNDSTWLKVTATLKSLEDGTTTQTVYFSNRPFIGGTEQVWPILKDVRGIGTRLGEILPFTQTGSIILDNSPGNIGLQRRFADLLERWVLIDQPIAVSSAASAHNVSAIPTFAVDFQGIVSGYTVNAESQEISLTIVSAPLQVQERTMLIDSERYPDAPSESVGRYVPLVFGAAVEVRPLRITANNSWPMSLLYATNFSSDFQNGGAILYLCRGRNGAYDFITSATAVDTAEFTDGGAYNSTNVALTYGKLAFQVWDNATDDPKLTYGFTLNVVKAVGARAGTIRAELYPVDPTTTKPAASPVAIAEFDKANLTTGAGRYDIAMRWDRIAFLGESESTKFFIALSQDDVGGAGANDVSYGQSNIGTVALWYSGTTNEYIWQSFTADEPPLWGLMCCQITDNIETTNDASGFRASYMSLVAPTAAASQTDPDPTLLDLIVGVNGLEDNAGGDVTGSVGARIEVAPYICQLMDYAWDGFGWAALGDFDGTLYGTSWDSFTNSANLNYREIDGRFEGRTFAADVIERVCEQSACRVGKRMNTPGSGQWGVWAWGGASAAASTVLTDENSRILNWTQRGVETIVNNINFRYYKAARDLGSSLNSISGDQAWYGLALKKDYTTDAESESLARLSTLIYGNRTHKITGYDLLQMSKSAGIIARFLMATFAYPHVFTEIAVPFFENRTLELFDIVEILHPDLPGYFGTATKSQSVEYDGTEVDLLNGLYLKRAQRYRGQIEGKQIDYSSGRAPQLILSCRVLTNYPNDPT